MRGLRGAISGFVTLCMVAPLRVDAAALGAAVAKAVRAVRSARG